jgi:hypothetical protein
VIGLNAIFIRTFGRIGSGCPPLFQGSGNLFEHGAHVGKHRGEVKVFLIIPYRGLLGWIVFWLRGWMRWSLVEIEIFIRMPWVDVAGVSLGRLEKPSRADGVQGAPQRIPETYHEDRRGVSEEATMQSVRAVGFSRCPILVFIYYKLKKFSLVVQGLVLGRDLCRVFVGFCVPFVVAFSLDFVIGR